MGRLFGRSEKGAAMVELAIVLPILLIVLFGIIEFSLILYDKALITNASREGARTGVVFRVNPATGAYYPYQPSEIRNVVLNYLDNGNRLIPPATPNIPQPIAPCSQTVPSLLNVTVTYTYNFFVLPNLVTSITGPITLTGVSVMRCE